MSTYPDEIFCLLAGTKGSSLYCTSTLKFMKKIGEFTKDDKTAVGTKQKESAEQTRQKVPLCR